MIVCEHCETGRCLRLDPEKSEVEVDVNGDLACVEEHYECVETGLTGIYRWCYAAETAHGVILDNGNRPHTIAHQKKSGGDRGETA